MPLRSLDRRLESLKNYFLGRRERLKEE